MVRQDHSLAGRLELLRGLMAQAKREQARGGGKGARERYARALGLAREQKRVKEITICEAALR